MIVKQASFAVLAATVLALAAQAHAVDLEQYAVFVSGQGGYHTYRIPSLIATGKGTLLAFCEGRKDVEQRLGRHRPAAQTQPRRRQDLGEDPGHLGRRAEHLRQPLPGHRREDRHDLAPAHAQPGRRFRERPSWTAPARGRGPSGSTKSPDEGATWSRPVEITATREAAGLDLVCHRPRGRHPAAQRPAGRALRQHGRRHARPSSRTSSSATTAARPGGSAALSVPHCDESQVVELADGRLVLNIRSYRGDHRRLVAISTDGGETFSPPVADEALIEPVCQASICRLPGEARRILFSNPASTKRERMTVRLSTDGGKTWPYARVLHEGPAAYSCLAELPDGDFACLYERGKKSAYETITLARLSRSWLAGGTRDVAQAADPLQPGRRFLHVSQEGIEGARGDHGVMT